MKLDVVDGIQFLAFELKFLYWYHYPLKSMPENFSPEKLAKLDLCFCSSLTKLTSNSHSPNFSDLNLQDYMNLREFLLISDNMKVLKLQWTKVKALSSSFEHHRKLKWLHLKGSHFERLPSLINNLIQQQHLHAISCRELQTIPELPLFIETLYADSCTSLQTLLEFPPSLKTLNIKKCRSLQTLPEILLFLETLDVAYGTSLKTLLGLPPFLKTQNTGECKSLQSLTELPLFLKTLKPPLFLETLNATSFKSLNIVLFPSTVVEQLKENKKLILFWNWSNLNEHSLVEFELNAQINVMKFASQHLSMRIIEYCVVPSYA
ncbi:Disease resistance protein RRS1 [Glycine soja]